MLVGKGIGREGSERRRSSEPFSIPHLTPWSLSAAPYLSLPMESAAVQSFLTRLGCSIKEGSLYMRILIAEDDEALAKFVRQGLESEHYSVEVFKDGEQARAAATDSEYDLVVLDLNLPKLDGVSVLRHLRVKKPSVPVLVLTQRTKVEDRVNCLDSGADDYIRKPFTPDQVKEHVLPVLAESRQ